MVAISEMAQGRGSGFPRGGSGRTADPADRAQLERAPVSLRRVAALFRPYRWQVATVVALIVASSTVALATPFLVRLVIDEALPRQDVRLLALAAAGMLGVAATTAVLGVVQTWLSTTVGQPRALPGDDDPQRAGLVRRQRPRREDVPPPPALGPGDAHDQLGDLRAVVVRHEGNASDDTAVATP